MNELDFLWLKTDPQDWARFLKSHVNRNKSVSPPRDRKQPFGQSQNTREHSWMMLNYLPALALSSQHSSEQLLPQQAAHPKEMQSCCAVLSAHQCMTGTAHTTHTDWHRLGPDALCIKKHQIFQDILKAKNFRSIVCNSYLAITKNLFVRSEQWL